MKTYFVLFPLFIICFSLSGYSQENKVVLGAGGGMALTNMRFDDSLNVMNPTLRAHAGIYADFKIIGSFYIGSGLNFRTKAIRSDKITLTDFNGNPIGETWVRNDFKFLTIPVFLNYYFGDRVKFKLGFGGYYGVLANASIEQLGIEIEGQNNESIDVTDQYSKTDFGLTARLGVMIPIYKRLHFNFDVVDEFGLAKVEYDAFNRNVDYNTHSLSAGAGLALTF